MPDLCTGCPMCGGDAPVLGILGPITWHRCEGCGWTFTPGEEVCGWTFNPGEDV